MRQIVEFLCEDVTLIGTLDEGPLTTGLLIVSGGNEIRMGAHRGMAQLAKDIAAKGHPVFRFDRRGIGDSAGDNHGFESSGPDIAAAIAAFRVACPRLTRIIAFGNCDAATALVLRNAPVDAFMLANPWVVEATDNLPPAAAIKDRYARRLRDPAAWAALLTGKIDLRALSKGLGRIASKAESQSLAENFAKAFSSSKLPATILLAMGDNTAVAFLDAWKSDSFSQARTRTNVELVTLDSSSHSFAREADYAALVATLTKTLSA